MIGDASKRRLFAAWLDYLLAILCALLLGGRIPWPHDIVTWIVAILTFLAYYFLTEAFFGATLGKGLFGLKVCTLEGDRASLIALVIRTILRVVEVNPILLGGLPAGLMIVTTKSRQRLGGKLSNTVVVRKDDLRAAARNSQPEVSALE
ncbi:MAG: RDD family protein [bacterium]|nr:RDD family protein [bacterium]